MIILNIYYTLCKTWKIIGFKIIMKKKLIFGLNLVFRPHFQENKDYKKSWVSSLSLLMILLLHIKKEKRIKGFREKCISERDKFIAELNL